MKNIYKNGFSTVVVIVVTLLVIVIGFYFYSSSKYQSVNTESPAQPVAKVESNGSTRSSGQPTSEGAAQAVTVDISNFAFAPVVITVKSGTTVTWTNKDAAPHTITSDTGAFDSGNLAPASGKFSKTFSEVGTFAYHCNIHKSMKATVIVTQ
jgi:plastocyanin